MEVSSLDTPLLAGCKLTCRPLMLKSGPIKSEKLSRGNWCLDMDFENHLEIKQEKDKIVQDEYRTSTRPVQESATSIEHPARMLGTQLPCTNLKKNHSTQRR